MPGDLLETVQHRRQIEIMDHIGVAGHMARQDVDLRPRPQGLPHGSALFGGGDKEPPRPRPRQGPRHPRSPQPVGIGLDHRSGLHPRSGGFVQRAPVGGNGIEINGQMCCRHEGVLTGAGVGSRGISVRGATSGGIEPPLGGVATVCAGNAAPGAVVEPPAGIFGATLKAAFILAQILNLLRGQGQPVRTRHLRRLHPARRGQGCQSG